jgi:transcriptional regulator with XRE-family HTH domain
MTKNSTLGGRIRKARKKHGLGFIETAQRAGIDKSLLSKLERGERNDMRLSTAIKLSKALRISLEDLAGI